MLISTEVEVGLSGTNIKWFEDKGYNIPRVVNTKGKNIVKKGTKIKVKVEDLSDGSTVRIDIQCDGCGEILNLTWEDYKRYVKEDGKYYCQKCSTELFARDKMKRTRLKNGKSFYQWCYDNLSKDEANIIMLRWDYELNIISPENVNYTSHGFNKKGYWFKCLDHPEHKSEQKDIIGITMRNYNYINCKQCNTLAVVNPRLIEFLVNKEDAYKYSYGSYEKVLMKCPCCGHEKERSFSELTINNFACEMCSDHISYSEKFFANLLKQLLKSDFEIQLAKRIFKWCKGYRYDFYIPKINGIVETHGSQHYVETGGSWDSLKKIQENDKQKEKLAKDNGITNYIVIDCRKSELEWIKNNIMNSSLPSLLNFKEEDIDWLKCHEYACSSLVKKACNLWVIFNNTTAISKELKINVMTVRNYLKKGKKLGWCDYNPKKR